METRFLNEKDALAYQKIRLHALKNSPTAFASTYEREQKFTLSEVEKKLRQTDSSFVMGIFLSNCLAGILTFSRELGVKTDHKGNIYGIYVHPDFQNQGAGKQLLTTTISYLITVEGLKQVNLTVNSTNKAAINLYSSFGFKIFGCEKNALKVENEYFDENLMVLKL